MQLEDSAGNIAAIALLQTSTLSFCTFRSFLLFSERFLKVEDCIVQQVYATTLATLFKRVTCPLCFSSKKYQIPFCSLRKRISYNMRNKRVLHAVFEYLPAAFKRVTDCLLNYCKRYLNTLASELHAESADCMKSKYDPNEILRGPGGH
jgi:hypothetical protein